MTWSCDDPPVTGVHSMDHTADIGIEVVAPDLPELFLRAALATLWMVLEHLPMDAKEKNVPPVPNRPDHARHIRLEAEGPTALLRAWLREVLYLHELEGFAVTGVDFRELAEGRLDANATGVTISSDPVREIKGVTWHDLRLEPRRKQEGAGESDHGWFARVIFDV